MEVDELKQLNIANKIQGMFNQEKIVAQLEKLGNNSTIYITKKKISAILPKDFKLAIIDFESSPVILMGILISHTIITLYVKKLEDINQFYLIILKAIKILKDCYIFAFSNFESKEILKIYRYLETQAYDLSDFQFIESLPIINLQEYKYESLIEALYTIDPIHEDIETSGDILLRNSRLIPSLFKLEKIKMIIEHNRNCLSNESVILLKRWLKNYRISIIRNKRVSFHN